MIETIQRTTYKAFGLTVLSEIPLPECIILNVENETVDVVIEKADLSTFWSEQSNSDEDSGY